MPKTLPIVVMVSAVQTFICYRSFPINFGPFGSHRLYHGQGDSVKTLGKTCKFMILPMKVLAIMPVFLYSKYSSSRNLWERKEGTAKMKVYRRFLASYLCVCLIPLLLSFIAIIRLEGRVQASIMAAQESSVQSVRQETDQTLGYAANLVSIFSEDALASYLSKKDALSAEELFTMCELSESLSRAIGQNDAFYRGFCYFARSGFLVTDRRTYHPEAAGLFPWDLRISQESFYSLMDSGGSTEHTATVYRDSGGGWIIMLRSQYDLRSHELISCVGIVIQLDKSLSRWSTEDFEAFATGDDYGLICGGSRALQACELISRDKAGSGELEIDDQRYVYSQYQSTLSGIRYGFLTRRDAYYQEIRIVWTNIVIETIAILTVSIALAVFWSRRTYRPIKNILPYMKKTESQKAGWRSISELDSALVSFAREKESLETQVVQSEQQIRSAALGQYLLGMTESSSVLSQYLEEGQPYQLLAFIPAAGADSGESALQSLREHLDDILLDKSGGVSLQLQRCIAVLVQKALSYEEAAEIHFAAEHSLSLPLVCYMSDTYTRLDEAPQAWASVYRTLRHDCFWQLERRRGVWPALPEHDSAESYRDFLSHQKALTEYLSAGKRLRAAACLEKLLSEDLGDQTLPVEKVRRRYADTAELLLPYVPEDKAKDALQRLRQYTTAQEMGNELLELFGSISWEPEAELSAMKKELTDSVRGFIRSNYQDQALNASMIADHLNMNLSTLSHQYKAATGSGLLDELHAVRLEKAKELLAGGASVRETAERTGYADPRALIRAFKRYEGITPGQYAKGGPGS